MSSQVASQDGKSSRCRHFPRIAGDQLSIVAIQVVAVSTCRLVAGDQLNRPLLGLALVLWGFAYKNVLGRT